MNGPPISGVAGALLSALVVASLLLVWGGVSGLRRGGERTRPVLMLLCAAILIGNVLIWAA